jgi:protease I
MSSATARVGVVVSDGYQELEFWYPVLRFREEGAAVTVIGADGERTYVSKLGYPVIPDAAVSGLSPENFDLIVIPSGTAGAAERNGSLPSFLENAVAKGAILGAIGGAAQILGAAGLLRGRRVAAAAAAKQNLAAVGATCSDDGVVADDHIITARSPDDLPGFCRALAARLAQATR